MEDYEKIRKLIEEKWAEGKVVLKTIEGLASVPVREIVKQPVEGLLYDINRDIGTTWTLFRDGEQLPVIRLVNDIAAAHIIEYLMSQQPYDVDACGRRGRQGGIPTDISRKAEEYQTGINPPYDADDIISACQQPTN